MIRQPVEKSDESTFSLGWARKKKQIATVRFPPEVKEFLMNLFKSGINTKGKIDRSKKITPAAAHALLKAEVILKGWDVETHLKTEAQISNQFRQYKDKISKESWKVVQSAEVQEMLLVETIDKLFSED